MLHGPDWPTRTLQVFYKGGHAISDSIIKSPVPKIHGQQNWKSTGVVSPLGGITLPIVPKEHWIVARKISYMPSC
jgi:hypothetical protein